MVCLIKFYYLCSMDTLLGKNLEELQQISLALGLPKFTGKQIAEWLYVRRVTTFDEMTNISKKGRDLLGAHYCIGRHKPVAEAISKDGTKKYLFSVYPLNASTPQYIESVYIPEEDRATLCVSTQAGCKMGCKFCMTGTLGFHGHLSAADILNQIFSIPDAHKLTNIVYMGEGEPMDNYDQVMQSLSVMTSAWGCSWSPKRITVSSVGITPKLRHYIEECECHLAISLHNPFSIERKEIMPIEKVHVLPQLIEMLKQYDWQHQRRLTFEYICWEGVNDTPKHANELLRLLKGVECRVNLIRFHASPTPNHHAQDAITNHSSNERQMEWFRDYLTSKGISTTIRKSRGEDILAACGMLVNSLRE